MANGSARLGLPFLVSGQAQKDLTHNEALALIDAGLAPCVVGVGLNTPPLDPVIGQCWIIGATPEGAWSGQANALAVRTDGGWRFLAGVEGMRVWVIDQQLWATCPATGWTVGDERASRLLVDGVPVVGSRAAAVPAPTGGAVIDGEARTAIATLIARLEAHGLIEVGS